MKNVLKDFIVAILVTNGFQQDEMTLPKKALEDAGAVVHVISSEKTIVEGWNWYVPCKVDTFKVDVHLSNADAKNYDALLLPGGLTSPDDLRLDEQAITFVRGFAKKPIAAICHGPWLLIDAKLVKGLTVTSYPSIKNDLINAGAFWINKEVVRSKNIITSRSPEDIAAFNNNIIDFFARANKKRQAAKKIK